MSRLQRIRPRIDALLLAVWAIRDHWAEADEAVRASMLNKLHLCCSELDDGLYLMDDEAKRIQYGEGPGPEAQR